MRIVPMTSSCELLALDVLRMISKWGKCWMKLRLTLGAVTFLLALMHCYTILHPCYEPYWYNSLFCRFVGLPNVGKSTLTNLLAGAQHAEAANYVSALDATLWMILAIFIYVGLICRISICNWLFTCVIGIHIIIYSYKCLFCKWYDESSCTLIAILYHRS